MRAALLASLVLFLIPVLVWSQDSGETAEPTLRVWHNVSGNIIEIHARTTGLKDAVPTIDITRVQPNTCSSTGNNMNREGEEWVATTYLSNFVNLYQVYVSRDDCSMLASNLVLIQNREEDDRVKLNVTVESLNLTLPSLGVIRVNASSPNGIYSIEIAYSRFSTRQLDKESHSIGAGFGCGGINSTRVFPSPEYVPRDRNFTDGICLYAIIAFDKKNKLKVKTGNITIGTPNILIPEPALLPILILLPALLRRKN